MLTRKVLIVDLSKAYPILGIYETNLWDLKILGIYDSETEKNFTDFIKFESKNLKP